MKRNTPQKTVWQLAWEAKTFPAKLPQAKKMSRADVVFCLMLWLGMGKIDAYQTAYPTKASRNSLAAMATRKSQEPWVEIYLNALYDYECNDRLKFNSIP